MDVFSLPEMTLLAVANDYFISSNIEYDPVHLYRDVSVSRGLVIYTALKKTFTHSHTPTLCFYSYLASAP